MHILVTGANGQLGCSLQKIAGAYPQHTFVYTDLPETDITDKTGLEALVEHHRIELIVNCAAYTAVDRAESEPELARKINCEGPRTLARVTKERGLRLIHVSTDYVFDGESCHPLKEDQPTSPTGVYGITKLAGEKAIEETGCNAAIVRTAWLYSEFGNNFVKTMLKVGAQRESLSVVYDQIGTPTYAPDLAAALLHIAGQGIEGFQVYHFSGEGVISWYDFAKEIFEMAGMPTRVEAIESWQYPSAAKRPAYSVLAKDKIKQLGAVVPYWKDSLKVCFEALKQNPS